MLKDLQRNAWIIFFIIGLFFLFYAIDNIFVIPGLDCEDPERGWAWLTCEPEVIDYVKYWFRMLGIWAAAAAAFTLLVSATGFRQGQPWAWYAMWIVPLILLSQLYFIPWFFGLYLLLIAMSLAGLALPYRRFFPEG